MRIGLAATMAVATALALSACGSKPSNNASSGGNTAGGNTGGSTSSASGPAFSACMVLDTGGIDDKSFNESSYAGLQAAQQQNSSMKISYVPSSSSNDYTPNLKAEVDKGCDTVIAVGGLMENNVKAVAKANPNQHFAEVDAPSTGPNVYGMQFNTAQGGFLGGYLAAGMSKSGKVATWGGLNIPPVTIYMDGFCEGVKYYDQKNNAKVQVLGWNENNQKGGTFSQSFTDQNKGKQISQTFINQGADVIFPVAGGAGLGAGAAAQASGGKANVLWVDTDGCKSVSQYCKYFISSVTKNLSGAVQTYVQQAASAAASRPAPTSAR